MSEANGRPAAPGVEDRAVNEKRPTKWLWVRVSRDGYLCDFADMASSLISDCEHGHEEPHRVVKYRLVSDRATGLTDLRGSVDGG